MLRLAVAPFSGKSIGIDRRDGTWMLSTLTPAHIDHRRSLFQYTG